MLTWSRTLTRAWLAAMLGLALLSAGCSGSKDAGGTFVPAGTSLPGQGGGSSASTTPSGSGGGTASRDEPLAERVFRVQPTPKTTAQREALKVLQSYLDGVIVAFATNDAAASGMRRYATTEVYGRVQSQVAEQAKGGYVVYGPYTVTIDPSDVHPPLAVMDVCIDESGTRRHDARTDAAGKKNSSPYVQLHYSLDFQPGKGWLVTGSNGGTVTSCPT